MKGAVLDKVSRKEFDAHCEANLKTDHKLDRLMPLAELIPTLKRIAEDEQSKRWLAKRIVSFLKITAIIIGSMVAVIGIVWQLIKELRK